MKKPRAHAFTPNPLLKVQLPAGRSRFAMLMLACGFTALMVRAVWLQVWSNEFLKQEGEKRYMRTLELPAARGRITDRNGAILATSLPARAVFANPTATHLDAEQVSALARLLAMPERDLARRLAAESKTFVYPRMSRTATKISSRVIAPTPPRRRQGPGARRRAAPRNGRADSLQPAPHPAALWVTNAGVPRGARSHR